jgi:HD-GYP domain-containing protein (c-di-GMP phosphodiesterase class II)
MKKYARSAENYSTEQINYNGKKGRTVSEKIIAVISDIMTAVSNCLLYSKEHPALMHLSEKALGIMETLYQDDATSFTVLGDSLLVNMVHLNEKNLHVDSFIKKLRRKGIEKVVISKGLTAEELKNFISELAFSERIAGNYPHISSGVIEVKLKTGGNNIPAVMSENTLKVKEVYQGLSRFKRLDMVGLEDVVISFISTLKKEANILRLVSPVKSYSEYTYTHTTNVSVLSIFQAELMGFTGEILHDIGIAGLLHDVGKMFISKEIIEKKGKLDDAEWAEIKKHPSFGAMYLASLPDLPKIAMIAAYEHHMKFDGSGYPSGRQKNRKQHIISQIIAVSDFFDALRTERSYRGALEVSDIVMLLQDASGKDFNPVLVDNFVLALKKTG